MIDLAVFVEIVDSSRMSLHSPLVIPPGSISAYFAARNPHGDSYLRILEQKTTGLRSTTYGDRLLVTHDFRIQAASTSNSTIRR
jgi:hypothetical protein